MIALIYSCYKIFLKYQQSIKYNNLSKQTVFSKTIDSCDAIDILQINQPGNQRTLYKLFQTEHMSNFLQIIQPLNEIPYHQHQLSDEMFYCLEGDGSVLIEDESEKVISFIPGVMVFVQKSIKHKIKNNSNQNILKFVISLSPPQNNNQIKAENNHI